MPYLILPFLIIFGVVMLVVASKKNKAEQKAFMERKKAAEQARHAEQSVPAPASVSAPAAGERRPLEKRELARPSTGKPRAGISSAGKPIAAVDDCGGGSIHDGYHEGVTQFDNGRPAAVAGKLGSRLADEDDRLEKEKIAAENARRVMARIGKLPPLAQGMVYSEILGKPKSEVA